MEETDVEVEHLIWSCSRCSGWSWTTGRLNLCLPLTVFVYLWLFIYFDCLFISLFVYSWLFLCLLLLFISDCVFVCLLWLWLFVYSVFFYPDSDCLFVYPDCLFPLTVCLFTLMFILIVCLLRLFVYSHCLFIYSDCLPWHWLLVCLLWLWLYVCLLCLFTLQSLRIQVTCISASAGCWSDLRGNSASRTSCDSGRWVYSSMVTK